MLNTHKHILLMAIVFLSSSLLPSTLAYLDMWGDSDYTANPSWVVAAGAWTATPNSLINNNAGGNYIVLNDTSYNGHGLVNGSWTIFAKSTGDTGFSTLYRIAFFAQYSKNGVAGNGQNGYALKVSDSGNYDVWSMKKFDTSAYSDISGFCSAMPVVNNDIVKFVINKRGSKFNWSIYHNGVLDCFGNTTDSTYTTNNMVLNLQGYGTGSRWKYLNVSWYNFTVYGGSPVVTLNKNVFNFNESHRRVKKQVFSEGEEFYQGLNMTLSNGTFVSDSKCNVSFPFGSIERDSSILNFTLCNSGCSYSSYKSNITSLAVARAVRDTFHFDACHLNLASKPLLVNFCGVSFSIPAASMRLCSLGNSSVFINTSACIGKSYSYAIFTNSASLSQAHKITKVAVDRQYSSLYMKMDYNATSKFYKSNSTTEYYAHGSYNANVSCSNANTAFSFTNFQSAFYISNIPPLVYFGQVATNDYVKNLSVSLNSTKLEYSAGRWNWTPAIIDNDLDWIKATWKDNNSVVIFTNSSRVPKTFKTRDALFVRKGFYYYTLYANDTNKNFTTYTMKFFLNDTIHPYCSGLTNKSVTNGTTYYFNGTCVDENFYSLNISCSTGTSYNWTRLNTTSFSFVQPLLISKVGMACKYNYCDAHTKKEIPVMQVSKSINKGELKFDNTVLKFNKKVKDFKWEKKVDRYSFCFQPDEVTSYVDVKIPDGCTPYASGISGHLVCWKDRVWIDFVSPDANYVYTNDSVRLLLKGGLSEYCFNSIGKLNCVSDTAHFFVYVPPKNSTARLKVNYCPDTVPSAYMLILIAVIAMFLIAMAFIFRIGVLSFIGGLLFLVLGYIMVDCFQFVGVALYVTGGVFMLFSFLLIK